MKALVTGADGFVAPYLARHLLQQQMEVFGVVRQRPIEPMARQLEQDGIQLVEADLLVAGAVRSALQRANPDLVFHLAAQSAVTRSWDDPAGTLVNNAVGQINLLEAACALGLPCRVLVVGSNEEYGACAREELPTNESQPLRPLNPYAVSKVTQDLLGYQYHASRHVHCVRVRPFTHIGPGQSDTYAVSSFARQVAEAEVGLREPVLLVGNLEVERDITDVRDMVRAYAMALELGAPGEVYNLGSGITRSMRSVLDLLRAQSGVALRVKQDPARMRRADVPVTLCDASRFRAVTGWQPQVPFERTLGDILAYWRASLSQSPTHPPATGHQSPVTSHQERDAGNWRLETGD
ncbi:MAG: GDP-mannose 4,6-dehydratase [Chloroflexi bacterium]|nr:GDP-mannose 4,6-dehydratase [Chloroflexota bacterium]